MWIPYTSCVRKSGIQNKCLKMGNVTISWNWRMKGNMKECANWRGITLLLKLNSFSRVLSEKMKEEVETITILRDEQVGFRPERRCTDQIATLLMILEQSLERNTSLCVVFISVRLWTGSWRKQQKIKQEESNGLCLNTLKTSILQRACHCSNSTTTWRRIAKVWEKQLQWLA